MDDTTNSSLLKDTTSNKKTQFKKPVTKIFHNFDVSLNESNTEDTQISKTDVDSLNIVSANRNSLFKKASKGRVQEFDTSMGESTSISDLENTVAHTKSIFKSKPIKDAFCVSFHETLIDDKLMDSNQTFTNEVSGSISSKANPFKKQKKLQKSLEKTANENSYCAEEEFVVENNYDESVKNLTSVNSTLSLIDSKINKSGNRASIFRKKRKSKNESLKQSPGIHVSFMPDESGQKNSPLNGSTNTEINSKAHVVNRPFSFKNTSTEQNQFQVSNFEDEFDKSSETKTDIRYGCEKIQGNFTVEKNLSKIDSKDNISDVYLDQSSFNDDNLNNWMSDQSEDEMAPPNVSPIQTNTSVTKEKFQEEELQEENLAAPIEENLVEPTEENLVGPTEENLAAPTEENLADRTEEIQSTMSWEDKFNQILSSHNNTKEGKILKNVKVNSVEIEKKVSLKKKFSTKETKDENIYKPPKFIKPAPFATKRLYQFIINKIEPKFGIDSVIKAEELVLSICDTVKIVTRRKNYQKKYIKDLKNELASLGVIQTTVDFYEFVIQFLPHSFRVKVVPCVQPITNTVFPPKDVANPFDKIV